MCIFSKYFKSKPDLQSLSQSQLSKYIKRLDKKISDEKIAAKLDKKSNEEKENLYQKIEQREHARLILQKKIDDSKM